MARPPRETIIRRLRQQRDAELFRAVNAALYECADTVRAEAFRSISEGSGSRGRHVPSKPGEPPHRDTGVLQAHIETTQPAPLMARVTSSAPYSVPLEFGTSKMPARPFLRPARDKVKDKALKILAQHINRAKRGMR